MGAGSIDRLEVEVETQATKANKQLDKLVVGLEKLSKSLKSVSGKSNSLITVNAGIKKLGLSFNALNLSGNKLFKTSGNITAGFTRMYVGVKTLERGINALKGSIKNSMDYIETLNYFDAAFGQVANNAVSQWEEAGYVSAEAYYNSFSSRAKELTSKMTGFNVNSDGTLTATGNASLGINPTKLMNYQATFAQMASSMGVTSETSLLLSQALTEIGADLASVKNMDFDKVWTDMASGLAGMSRTLDKYGVNIRNVNLQQKLFDLGINENITNLNQNDKALLRTIILLDSTQYAWGDLADTISQPANQMRLLESNLGNLSRTIGNLFLPAVAKVLPYVNGLVIALQRLFTWIGSLMGIDLSEITSSIGSSEVDMSELLGDTEELTGNLDDATKAAEKLKKGIRSFDELNVINTSDDAQGAGGTGLKEGLLDKAFLDSFSKYQKAWDEAFAKMENRANKFADKIEKYFKPIKDIISDMVIGDFYKAGKDTSNLVAGIYNFFADAIDRVDWDKVGDDIGDFLSGIDWIMVIKSAFKLKFNIWKAIAEVWFGSFEAAPIETSIMTAIAALKFKKIGKLLGINIAGAITGTAFSAAIIGAFASLGGIGGILTMDMAVILGAGSLAEIGVAVGTGIIGGFVAAVGGFAFGQWLNEVITGEKIDMSWAEQFDAIKESFSDGSWKGAIELWGKDIKVGFESACESIESSFSKMGDAICEWWDDIIWDMKSDLKDLKESIADAFSPKGTLIGPGVFPTLKPSQNSTPGRFATGGFPEDGFFYANHTELVGRFTNGKTAVANNEQIVSGIEAGVERAVASVLAPYLADIAQNTRETADKDFTVSNETIGKGARAYARDYFNRTGEYAYN